MSNVEYGLIMQEIERGDSGLRSFVSVQGALVMYPIYTYGSEEQKAALAAGCNRVKPIGCFGLTSPASDRIPRECSPMPGARVAWILNGRRPGSPTVGRRRRRRMGAHRGLAFRDSSSRRDARATRVDIHGKLSMRASVTSSLSFSDCRVPSERAAFRAKGLKAPLCVPDTGAIWHWMGRIGAAMDCYETARQYSIVRKQFDDRPIASHQFVQEKLAWMITEITKAQLLALHAGRLKDAASSIRLTSRC